MSDSQEKLAYARPGDDVLIETNELGVHVTLPPGSGHRVGMFAAHGVSLSMVGAILIAWFSFGHPFPRGIDWLLMGLIVAWAGWEIRWLFRAGGAARRDVVIHANPGGLTIDDPMRPDPIFFDREQISAVGVRDPLMRRRGGRYALSATVYPVRPADSAWSSRMKTITFGVSRQHEAVMAAAEAIRAALGERLPLPTMTVQTIRTTTRTTSPRSPS